MSGKVTGTQEGVQGTQDVQGTQGTTGTTGGQATVTGNPGLNVLQPDFFVRIEAMATEFRSRMAPLIQDSGTLDKLVADYVSNLMKATTATTVETPGTSSGLMKAETTGISSGTTQADVTMGPPVQATTPTVQVTTGKDTAGSMVSPTMGSMATGPMASSTGTTTMPMTTGTMTMPMVTGILPGTATGIPVMCKSPPADIMGTPGPVIWQVPAAYATPAQATPVKDTPVLSPEEFKEYRDYLHSKGTKMPAPTVTQGPPTKAPSTATSSGYEDREIFGRTAADERGTAAFPKRPTAFDEPKGKGKRAKGTFVDAQMFEVIERNRNFVREVTNELQAKFGTTIEDYVSNWADVQEEYALWLSRRTDVLEFGASTRIQAEWRECVLRQMLVLKQGIFGEAKWRRFEQGLLITHGGHLLHPRERTVVWSNSGRPKPSNPM